MKMSGVYSYCFSQIFQGLCLLEGLRLLGTPEYKKKDITCKDHLFVEYASITQKHEKINENAQ